jgi:hypothetical protein
MKIIKNINKKLIKILIINKIYLLIVYISKIAFTMTIEMKMMTMMIVMTTIMML